MIDFQYYTVNLSLIIHQAKLMIKMKYHIPSFKKERKNFIP